MSLPDLIVAIDTELRAVAAFSSESNEIVTGARKLATFNGEPPNVKDALDAEIATYDKIIADAKEVTDALNVAKGKINTLLGDGYPNQPVLETFFAVLADLKKDLEQEQKAIDHLHALAQATTGEIVENDL